MTSDTLSYIEPVQSIIEYRKDGIQRALAGGDIQSACANTLVMIETDQMRSGVPLTEVKKALASAQEVSQWNACNVQFSSPLNFLHSLAALIHSFSKGMTIK